MTELSFQTQAIVNAAVEAGGGYGNATPVLHARLAAALRAAADQVVPEPSDIYKESLSLAAIRNRCKVRDELLAIAAELEDDND